MDSPQRAQICQTKSPGSVTKHGCGQCRVSSANYCNTTYDLTKYARNKESIIRIRRQLATMKGAALVKASMDTGVVADKDGLGNPFDKLHVDAVVQAPPETLHTNGRVSPHRSRNAGVGIYIMRVRHNACRSIARSPSLRHVSLLCRTPTAACAFPQFSASLASE